ncbi:hypothetical protein [Massilia sp. DD77]|uniref:hypothetical protein n=1 Tax=Massilia sp. DD77 TaxID=3109349 RepID=UPI002FFFACBF
MRYRLICLTVITVLCSTTLSAKNLCGVKVVGGDGKKANLSISNKEDLAILSRSDLGQRAPIYYSLKSGRLEREGIPVAEIDAEMDSTVYVADGIVRGCVIRTEERNGKKVLYLEELFHAPKQEPRIETQIIELE